MKKTLSLILVLVLLMMLAAPAYALTGTVKVGTWLNVRKGPAKSYATIGYLMNGDKVQVYEKYPDTGYVRIIGPISSTHPEASSISEIAFDMDNEVMYVQREGYVDSRYIQM